MFCNWVVCLKILIRESLFYGREIGIESRIQILPGHVAPIKKKVWDRKGPSQRDHSKSVSLMSVILAPPKFVERSREITLQQERCARKVAWKLARNIYMLKSADKA